MLGEMISHYRILDRLGQGGMGEVYLAEDTRLGRKVALKFLAPELARDRESLIRFRNEARAAAELSHPNIATIHEFDEVDGRTFLVLEYLQGQTLRERIARGPLPIHDVLRIGEAIASGLVDAHAHGIVHRDIKSANVMLTEKEEVKILDFGLAHRADATQITAPGTTLGTVDYMSPEQARGNATDERTDIWSLGVVLYECLTGRPPFLGERVSVLEQILTAEPTPPTGLRTGVPMELEQTTLRCLEKDPQLRYQHADDLLAKLRSIRSHGSEPASSTRTPRRRFTPSRWPLVLGILLAIAVIGVGLRLLIGSDPTLRSAHASRDVLAVLYFDNLADPTDDGRLGEIATNLLITDLSESSYLRVLSSQRLYDILRLKGKEGLRVIDRVTAGEVARHAGARTMLLGSILRIDPGLLMTSQLVEVETGEVLASQRIEGTPEEDVFAVVDRLSASVREDLAAPGSMRQEIDVPVASVTTRSIAAYRLYLQGLEEQKRHHKLRAMEFFQQAVAADSTFAMAWLELSDWGSIYTTPRETRDVRYAVAQALRHVDQAGWKERHLIRARSAWIHGDREGTIREFRAILQRDPDEKRAHYALGVHLPDLEESIHHLRRVTEIDPLDWESTNQLAYRFMRKRDRQNALETVDRYLALAPGESNPWDSRGEIYAAFGEVDSALVSYRRAYRIDPEFYTSQLSTALVLMFAGEFDEAQRAIESLLSSERPEVRSFARLHLATGHFMRGKVEDGIDILERGLARDEQEGLGATWPTLAKRALIGMARLRQGRVEEGLVNCEETMQILRASDNWRRIPAGLYFCTALAQAGRFEQAEREIQTMENTIEELRPDLSGPADLAHAFLALARREGAKAEQWALRALDRGGERWIGRYVHALARLEQGRAREAALELEDLRIMYIPDQIHTPCLPAEVRYHCARAWDEAGERARAIERYEEFLRLWQDADSGIRLGIRDSRDPENAPLVFAGARLKALRTRADDSRL